MTQNEKDILLRDLCARLPYGVKILIKDTFKYSIVLSEHHVLDVSNFSDIFSFKYKKLDKRMKKAMRERPEYIVIKPYLFPLSSMTEEQKDEISKRYNYHNPYELCVEITNHSEGYWDNDTSCNLQDYLWLEDWFNKNHFDYRGLIPMGLAIDATNKDIY